MDWFLFDNGLRHERIKAGFTRCDVTLTGQCESGELTEEIAFTTEYLCYCRSVLYMHFA